MAGFDPDTLSEYNRCVVIISTWENGTPPPSAAPFVLWLIDEARDFRVHKTQLAHMRYAVVGLGNSVYGHNFCKCAREVDSAFRSLSATPILPLTLLDQDHSRDLNLQFNDWMQAFWNQYNNSSSTSLSSDFFSASRLDSDHTKQSKKTNDTLVESESEDDEHENAMVDVEDLGKYLTHNLNTSESKVGSPLSHLQAQSFSFFFDTEHPNPTFSLSSYSPFDCNLIHSPMISSSH
jgi:tRNA wybutosine-synthesizing protein 1